MFTDQWDGFLAERRNVLSQAHQSGYGYDLYEITPQQWSTKLRVVSDRADPNATVSTLTTWGL